MDAEKSKDYSIEIGPMGPIGEGESLILRVTRNCPWNRCLFCPVYKDRKFGYRDVPEIKGDIDAIKRIVGLLETTSWRIGCSGRINREVVQETVGSHPEIYGKDLYNVTQESWPAIASLNNVANWLIYGAKRVFLQDANALIMRPRELVEVLTYLKETFPTIQIITCYARSKTCSQRSLEELRALKKAGLSWLFVGIESGCDEVLKYMQKGVTGREHISGGQKVIGAGINLAAFVMPGLAGKDGKLSQQHVSETVAVLNEMEPTEVRIRSLAVLEGTPLYARWESGDFKGPTDDQMIDEIRMLIEGLDCDCTIETLQMTNVLFTIKGRLSAQKDEMLAAIARYQALSPMERARFQFNRYVYDGYLGFVEGWGKLDSHVSQLIQEAQEGLEKGSPDAVAKTEQAIFAIKSKGVP